MFDCKRVIGASGELQEATGSSMYCVKGGKWARTGSDMVTTVNYHSSGSL